MNGLAFQGAIDEIHKKTGVKPLGVIINYEDAWGLLTTLEVRGDAPKSHKIVGWLHDDRGVGFRLIAGVRVYNYPHGQNLGSKPVFFFSYDESSIVEFRAEYKETVR